MKRLKNLTIFIVSLYYVTSFAQTPNIVTLSCVDSTNNFEMVVRFDEKSGEVFGVNLESKITNDVIYYRTEANGTFYKTYIYRSTGRYTVMTEGSNISFGGVCQVKKTNRF